MEEDSLKSPSPVVRLGSKHPKSVFVNAELVQVHSPLEYYILAPQTVHPVPFLLLYCFFTNLGMSSMSRLCKKIKVVY